MSATYTYWQDPKDGLFVGYWNDYPDYQTEGHTIEELRRMLISLRNDIAAMVADGTMECSSLHVGDATIDATVAKMMPNTADMVRVHRLTGMRPCELCALRWSLIDTSRTPWVYRVPAYANKNDWRGELGQPRVVCIGPKARAILERHRGGGDVPFSPAQAMAEYLDARRAARATPIYGKRKDAPHVPRVLGERWDSHAYGHTIRAACRKAGVPPWGANRLRHAFGTEVRRAFGLDAARAVLGHSTGGRITDVYTFDAVEDETVRRAAPAVEALG